MSAVERRTRTARARECINQFSRTDPEQWAAAASQLIYCLDESCREKLNSGRHDLFGSIVDLRSEWNAALGHRLPAQDDKDFQDALFEATLDRMANDGDLVFVTDRQRARSRAFETVHYLRQLRQRTRKYPGITDAPRLIEMVKAEPKRRARPTRTHNIAELHKYVDDALVSIEEATLSEIMGSVDFPELIDWALEVFDDFLVRAFHGSVLFAGFQIRSTEKILSAACANKSSGIAIAAGTGFGKTEAFLLPILFYCILAKVAKCTADKSGVDALLVYPRRDLCNDQADRLLGYLIHLNSALETRWSEKVGEKAFEPIRLALAHGGMGETLKVPCPLCRLEKEARKRDGKPWTAEDENDAWLIAKPDPKERNHRGLFRCARRGPEHSSATRAIAYQIDREGDDFDIAITNLDTLHRRLMDNHGRQRIFSSSALPPRLVVLDEMHIYEGQAGGHAANIIRRLRQRVRAMRQDAEELIVIGASATVHAPNELLARLSGVRAEAIQLELPTEDEERRHGLEYFFFLQSPGNRLIGGNDDDSEEDLDHSSVGPRRFVSEQAAMIQAAMCLEHTMKATSGERPQKRRVLGFVDSLDIAARLSRNLDNAEWQDAGPRSNGGPATMNSAPLYTLRLPTGRPDARTALPAAITATANEIRPNQAPALKFALPGRDCPQYDTGNCRQPPHHLLARCQRYEAGECWYVMGRGNEEGLRPLLIQKHQSGGRSWGFPRLGFHPGQDDENWRLLVTTSALEVGFDHSELIATWQYHAPPSVAGFLQRKGRGGRGSADRPLTMMVLGQSDADIFAFQHHDRYVIVDDQRDLVCWVDPGNPSLRRQHVVAAIFDFCASIGSQTAYSMIDFALLAEKLRTQRPAIQRWIRGCFSSLTTSQIDEIVRSFERELTEKWLPPIVPSDLPWLERTPTEIFQKLTADTLRERAHFLSTRTDAQSIAAREWFLTFAASKQSPRVTAPDFFAALPVAAIGDPDLRLPRGTIPEPLGREVALYSDMENEIGRDPAEFALNTFLPGGFKIRFKNRLWAAPWEPPIGWTAPVGTRLSQAVLRLAEPDRPQSAEVPDLVARQQRVPAATFLAQETELSQDRQQEFLTELGSDADIVIVSRLRVRDLGSPTIHHFTLATATNAVRLSAAGSAGTTTILTRDPHLTTQKIILPLKAQQSEASRSGRPFASIRFYRQQRLMALHFANLVHCYPSTGGERTIAVHFRAADALARPLLPAVLMRTEAIELSPDSSLGTSWTTAGRGRAYWRRVHDQLGTELVVRQAVLDSFYKVDECVEALAALEAKAGEFASHPPNGDTLRRYFNSERNWLQELDDLLPHADSVASVLSQAAAWIFGPGLGRVQADTLSAALVKTGADALRLSPSAFRTLVEPYGDGWRILIYDNNEGGSGNARRLYEAMETWSDLTSSLIHRADCPIAAGDRAIAAIFATGRSADSLANITNENRTIELFNSPPEPATLRRLERLIETPEIAAFNIYAYEVFQQIADDFGGTPPLRRIIHVARRTPALDPRAEALRRSFQAGDSAEIGPRLRAILPLCESGCPYCIGHTDTNYADRTLLQNFTPDQ
jgi:hypothetical protein